MHKLTFKYRSGEEKDLIVPSCYDISSGSGNTGTLKVYRGMAQKPASSKIYYELNDITLVLTKNPNGNWLPSILNSSGEERTFSFKLVSYYDIASVTGNATAFNGIYTLKNNEESSNMYSDQLGAGYGNYLTRYDIYLLDELFGHNYNFEVMSSPRLSNSESTGITTIVGTQYIAKEAET